MIIVNCFIRKDIDAIIIATSDNWHARITIDALNSGKAVYCEKPVVQKISDGLPVIQAQKKTAKAYAGGQSACEQHCLSEGQGIV